MECLVVGGREVLHKGYLLTTTVFLASVGTRAFHVNLVLSSLPKGPQKHPTEWRPLLCNYVDIVLYGQKRQYQRIVGCGLGGPKRLDTAGIFLLRPNFQAYNVSCGPGCAWPVIKSRSLDVPHKKI